MAIGGFRKGTTTNWDSNMCCNVREFSRERLGSAAAGRLALRSAATPCVPRTDASVWGARPQVTRSSVVPPPSPVLE
jgi:hypothetical protein